MFVVACGLSEREQPEMDRMVAAHAQMCESAEQRKRKREERTKRKASSKRGRRQRGR